MDGWKGNTATLLNFVKTKNKSPPKRVPSADTRATQQGQDEGAIIFLSYFLDSECIVCHSYHSCRLYNAYEKS